MKYNFELYVFTRIDPIYYVVFFYNIAEFVVANHNHFKLIGIY